MAKKSKVKSTTFKSEWKNPTSGMIVYYHEIELENGDKGQIGTKAKEGLAIGEEINYSITEDGRGGFKIKKEQTTFQKAYTKAGDNAEYQNGIAVGHSLNNAVLLICAGKVDIKDLESTARRILEIAVKMKNELNVQ